MMSKAKELGREAASVAREVYRRASGNLALLARMLTVVAVSFACLQALNKMTPALIFGGPSDATAVVIAQFQFMTQAWVKLMSIGTHVLAFLGLA